VVGQTGAPGAATTVGFAVGAGNVCVVVHPAITIHRINELAMRSIPRDFLMDPDWINFPNDFISITNVNTGSTCINQ
jgi:hypothetical protein